MNGKTFIYSILAAILYIGILVGTVFLFKVHFMLGVVGVILLLIPLKLQRKAIDEANGKLDNIFAKYIVSILVFIALVFVVLYFTMWA